VTNSALATIPQTRYCRFVRNADLESNDQMIEMTATVLLKYKEIIVALIAVFGAVVPYLLQKNKELNLKIAEQKREAYTTFLKNFTEIAVAVMHDEDVSGKDADRERMLARDQLLLYASDDVIKARSRYYLCPSQAMGCDCGPTGNSKVRWRIARPARD
jgi:hypothetical protein